MINLLNLSLLNVRVDWLIIENIDSVTRVLL